jgi:hypothetical protein
MPSFSSYDETSRIKLLLIGHPKVGKTGLLATLANVGYKVRILDFDNNLAIIKSYLTPGAAHNIDYVSFDARTPESWKKAKALCRKWEDGTTPTDWTSEYVLVIDSASFWADACLVHHRAKNSKDPRQDYYAAQSEVEDEVAFLTSPKFKCHLILITHWRDQMQKADEVYKSVPALFGNNLPTNIPKYCNNVWAAQIKPPEKRILRTQSSPSVEFLGSSVPLLLDKEIDFDLGAAFRKIYPST